MCFPLAVGKGGHRTAQDQYHLAARREVDSAGQLGQARASSGRLLLPGALPISHRTPPAGLCLTPPLTHSLQPQRRPQTRPRRARAAQTAAVASVIMLRATALAILAVAASGFVAPAAPKQATALAASGSQIAYRIRRKRIANQVRDSAHHSLPAKLRLTCFSPAGQGPVAPERVPVEQPHLRPGHRR